MAKRPTTNQPEYSVKVTRNGHDEYGYAQIKWIPVEQWKEKMVTLQKEGEQAAEEMQSRGRPFQTRVLNPQEAPENSSENGELNLVAVVIERDWKVPTKLAMIEDANNFLTKAYNIGALNAALSPILGRVIEEKSLYEYSVGEFFFLYGRFEQKHRCSKSQQTRKKMEKLINGKKEFMKTYTNSSGKSYLAPLPYAVRNILAHIGNDQNLLRDEELKTAIRLLRAWVKN